MEQLALDLDPPEDEPLTPWQQRLHDHAAGLLSPVWRSDWERRYVLGQARDADGVWRWPEDPRWRKESQ